MTGFDCVPLELEATALPTEPHTARPVNVIVKN